MFGNGLQYLTVAIILLVNILRIGIKMRSIHILSGNMYVVHFSANHNSTENVCFCKLYVVMFSSNITLRVPYGHYNCYHLGKNMKTTYIGMISVKMLIIPKQ